MKKILYAFIMALLLGVTIASAQPVIPEGVQEFKNDCGYVCYVWPDGSGDCYECLECNSDPIEKPTETPKPPTETPEPTLEPTPEKLACNRGLGNGSEDCDPGNSGGKPGNAGEDNE